MISVVLATHNEARKLELCLKAVADWADEIIIADGESTDDTITIAKKYGAKIIATTNKANFHINKQLAMDSAKGELVLQLDADEAVDAELAAWVKETHQALLQQMAAQGVKKTTALTLQPDQPVSWWVKRRNWFLGRFMKKGGQYPDPVIRVYINGFARLPQKDVHEQMVSDGPVGWAEGHLLHYGTLDFSEYLQKFDRYTSFKAEQLHQAGVRVGWGSAWRYLIWQPKLTFWSLYLRHRGYVDGMAGFVFALFSGLHHVIAFLKLWEIETTPKPKLGVKK